MKYKRNNFHYYLFLCFLCLLPISAAVGQPTSVAEKKILIILASDNIETISIETIANLYTFRQKLMPNSQRARLTSLPSNSLDTINFTQVFFNYYPYQLKRIWERAIFSGKARRPKEFSTPEELLNYIKNNNNAIGYLLVTPSELTLIKEEYNVITTIS